MLAGEGARLWAKQHGCSLCDPDELITDRAKAVYLDHKSRLDGASLPSNKRRKLNNVEDSVSNSHKNISYTDHGPRVCILPTGEECVQLLCIQAGNWCC